MAVAETESESTLPPQEHPRRQQQPDALLAPQHNEAPVSPWSDSMKEIHALVVASFKWVAQFDHVRVHIMEDYGGLARDWRQWEATHLAHQRTIQVNPDTTDEAYPYETAMGLYLLHDLMGELKGTMPQPKQGGAWRRAQRPDLETSAICLILGYAHAICGELWSWVDSLAGRCREDLARARAVPQCDYNIGLMTECEAFYHADVRGKVVTRIRSLPDNGIEPPWPLVAAIVPVTLTWVRMALSRLVEVHLARQNPRSPHSWREYCMGGLERRTMLCERHPQTVTPTPQLASESQVCVVWRCVQLPHQIVS